MSVIVGAILLIAAQAAPDPLLPARSGQGQCYSPDTTRRTCRAFAQYKFSNDGKIENIAQVLISKDGPVVMLTASPVTIRAGAVCSALQPEDVRTAGFIVAGQPASDTVADEIRKQITPAMSKDFGKDVCETYVPADTGLTTRITVNGTAHPEMSEKVIWVSLNEGYAVAP